MDIAAVSSIAELEQVRTLFEEYWNSFGFTPCFQNFDRELQTLPGAYAPPMGRLALARIETEPTGCVALRPIDARRCELKRLYVRPAFRGRKLGISLLEWAIANARAIGYTTMLADTMPVMQQALTMYERHGFTQTAPYHPNPTPNAIYLEFNL